MIKKILLAGLLTLALGMPTMKAGQTAFSANQNRTSKRFAVAFQVPYNANKLGAGLRFSYDFTDILRFTVDGDYYFYNATNRRFRTITASGEKGIAYWGRQFDVNFNLNFVFGNGDFHFYVIAGVCVPIGYPKVEAILNDISDDSGTHYGTTIDGKYYYYKEKLQFEAGIAGNVGCGVEYQITEEFRVFLEQQASLGVMSTWMPKLGCAFCF